MENITYLDRYRLKKQEAQNRNEGRKYDASLAEQQYSSLLQDVESLLGKIVEYDMLKYGNTEEPINEERIKGWVIELLTASIKDNRNDMEKSFAQIAKILGYELIPQDRK